MRWATTCTLFAGIKTVSLRVFSFKGHHEACGDRAWMAVSYDGVIGRRAPFPQWQGRWELLSVSTESLLLGVLAELPRL